MKTRTRVLVATTNAGKLFEFQALLSACLPGLIGALELLSLRDVLPAYEAPEEDGASFEDNARIKAWAAAKATGLLTLADDSGLEVDALGGEPGVFSARYAGEHASDAENKQKLLEALWEVPDEKRGARFRCSIVMADPESGAEYVACGVCEGRIARAERGSGGFGYDPLFVVLGEGGEETQTLAELSPEAKNKISHRAKAVFNLKAELERRFSN